MDKTASRDWLLTGAKALTIIAIAFLIFALVMVGIGLGAVLTVGHTTLTAKLAEAGIPAMGSWMIAIILALVMGLLWIAQQFLREQLSIINSVAEGKPFATENAKRLKRMGWLSVAGQAIVLPIGAITAWLIANADEKSTAIRIAHSDVDFGLNLGTILLTLILFILARVFEHGARLEEDAEGTV
jgi:hypothetical protein